MRKVLVVDFIVQSILFAWVIYLLIEKLVSVQTGFSPILGVQLLIGTWQMISALAFLSISNFQKRWRIWHMQSALANLILLFALVEFSETAMIILMLIIPWILALFYYIITVKSLFQKSSRGSGFLPHLSF
jgi:hypothetical protein